MKIKKIGIITAAAFFSLSVQAVTFSGEDTKTVPLVFATPMTVSLNLTPTQGLVAQGAAAAPTTLATGSVNATNLDNGAESLAFPALKFNHAAADIVSIDGILAATLTGNAPAMNPILVELYNTNNSAWMDPGAEAQPIGGQWAINTGDIQNGGFEVKYTGQPSPGTYTLSMTAAVYSL